MKNINLSLGYQKSLIYAGLESLSPVHMLPEVEGGQFSTRCKQWKISVMKFISTNFKAKLIEGFPTHQLGFDFSNINQIEEILKNSDPTEHPEIWMGMQFTGTNKLRKILSFHGLDSWDAISRGLDHDFIRALKEIYEF